MSIKISQKEIYDKVLENNKLLLQMNGKVKVHRQWLLGLTSAFGVAFLFVIKLLV